MTRHPHELRIPSRARAARSRPRWASLASLAAVCLALPACDGCHASRPYTPYTLSDTVDGGAPSEGGTAIGPDGGTADAGVFAPVAATPAPGDGKSWPLSSGAVEPPAGHAFAEGIVVDADGDGTADLVAWSRAPDGLRGEVWFVSGKSPTSGRTLVALPGDLASPGCNPTASLTHLGPSMIVFDFDPHCAPRGRERAVHWIAVFRFAPGGAPELGLELRAGTPADGETLAVAMDGRDRDGDGRGDFTATFTLSGAPRPLASSGTAAATLAFFDRPAGLSRDPTEPEASIKALAASLVAEARKKSTAARVAGAAGAARRLFALLCDEAGRPLITTSAGPARCGDQRLLEDASMAETEAALNLGDPFAAVAAFGRIEPRRKDVDALVAKSVPSIAGRLVRTTAATPELQPSPAFGPIAFSTGGDLLVHTHDKVIRVDRTSFEEATIDAALTWPVRLKAAVGDAPAWTLMSVEERCDAVTLVARFDTEGAAIDVPLPILASPRCTATTRPLVTLLGTTAQGALVAVRGELLAILREAPPRAIVADALAVAPGTPVELGASRSPDGGSIAYATPRGILVATLKGPGRGASAKLWTTPTLDEATACVPNNAADRIACAVKNAVAIYDAK